MLYPLTPLCNQKCIFCSAYGRDEKAFNLKNFLSSLKRDKDKLIILSGGDPFLIGIENLIYIADFAVKENKKIEIQTNATLLPLIDIKKLKIFVTLLNKTGGYFNINFPAHEYKLDYKITNLKNGFKNRMEGIYSLNKLDAVIRITHVIHKINYKYLCEFAKFIIKDIPFISWVQFSFVKGMGRAKENKKLIPTYSSVSPFLLKAFEILERNGFRFEIDHIPLCFLGRFYKKHVDYKKIKNGFKGEYLKEKEKLLSCKGCRFYSLCSGPRKDYIEIYKKI